MAPIEANIFYVDDNRDALEAGSEVFEALGLHVVETAESKEEAHRKIKGLKEIGVSFAILDGNLTKGDKSMKDGKELAAEIREIYGEEIIIIGNSAEGPVEGAHYQKSEIGDSMQLAEFIKKL